MTIYALSSGLGVSGVAIIRVSGKETRNILTKLITGPMPIPRVATLRKISKIVQKMLQNQKTQHAQQKSDR